MNCAEFERQLMIDPACSESAFLSHWQNCMRCKPEADKVWHMNQQIKKLLAVDVPPRLSSRIIAEQKKRRKRPIRRLF
ncbi:MAG: DUF3379 domain-containing protein [gamma proteobacterium symbiont of Bathyaustriella thionipta]|nr:DUF3379 domain-containing protein [gamma proteobacterium symbiont of Bathyaustriella thionipta]